MTSQHKRLVGRRHLLAAGGAALAYPSLVRAQAPRGAALVIGNSRYQWEAPLPNVRRDAPDIAKHFQAMGLKTELIEDAGKSAMMAAIARFQASLRGADLGALYFAGHGAQWVKDAYLVPIDADLSTPNSVGQLVPVGDVKAGMSGAAHHLMVFDNCRNSPADGWDQVETMRAAVVNLTKLSQAPNQLMLYSTAPGRVALDGPAGQNSPFCTALLRQLEQPTVDFLSLPSGLRRDLLMATDGRQVVFDTNTFTANYRLPGAIGLSAGARSGWGNPARIVELPNAYAMAAQMRYPLPGGLIAHRVKNPAEAQMIGSFRFVLQIGGITHETILIVLTVDGGTAECIICGNSTNGPFWRSVTATVSGSTLEYIPRDETAIHSFTWHDASGGLHTQKKDTGKNGSISRSAGGARGGSRGPNGAPGGVIASNPFTRLDG
jgi:hypothetical protein